MSMDYDSNSGKKFGYIPAPGDPTETYPPYQIIPVQIYIGGRACNGGFGGVRYGI